MTDKITIDRSVLEQALEALWLTDSEEGTEASERELLSIRALRAALEQPQGDPVGCLPLDGRGGYNFQQPPVVVQPQVEQQTRYLAGGARYKVTHLAFAGYCIHGLPREMLGQWVAFVDATDNKHMDSRQPPRQPLTDKQIDAIMMPLTKNQPYSWRKFARAIERAHEIGGEA